MPAYRIDLFVVIIKKELEKIGTRTGYLSSISMSRCAAVQR